MGIILTDLLGRLPVKNKAKIHYKIRTAIIIAVVVTILVTAYMMTFTINRIANRVSSQFAKMYTGEIVNEIESYLSREIALSEQLAKTDVIKSWLIEESNLRLKREVYQSVDAFNTSFTDHNLFLVSDASKQLYFLSPETHFLDFNPIGTLAPSNADDFWYFDTLSKPNNYSLNIDRNRFFNDNRIWINVKVTFEDRVVGMVGTGLYLDHFINDVLNKHDDGNAISYIIDQQGIIQIASDESLFKHASTVDSKNTIYRYSSDEQFKSQVENYIWSDLNATIISLSNSTRNYDYAAFERIEYSNWHVVTFYSKDALFSNSNFISIILITALTAIILGFIINGIVNRLFVEPFNRLNDSIRRKDLYHDEMLYGLDREDEFGELSKTIEVMTDRLVRSVPVGMFILDESFKLTYANAYFLEQFKCDLKDLLQLKLHTEPESLFVSPEDYFRFRELLLSDEPVFTFEAQMIDFNNQHFWAEVHISKLTSNYVVAQYEGILINIQSKKSYEQKLYNLATTDALTGIVNRYHFEEIVLEEIERSERYGGFLSLIVFDLDAFKSVNDTFGHLVGDSILTESCRIAESVLRTTDTIGRWGGEEFAILLPGTSSNGAWHAAEKIRLQLEATLHPVAGVVTASFGVSERHKNEPYIEWFKRADEALYMAKEKGRNRVISSKEEPKGLKQYFKIVWQDSFYSGNEIIDLQHQELIELANKILDLEASKTSHELYLETYESVVSHFLKHTLTEETILADAGYPHEALREHAKAHHQLNQQLNDLRESIDKTPIEVFKFLVQDVILGHMLIEDVKFFNYTRHLKT